MINLAPHAMQPPSNQTLWYCFVDMPLPLLLFRSEGETLVSGTDRLLLLFFSPRRECRRSLSLSLSIKESA